MTDQVRFTADKRELVSGLAWAVKGIGTRPVVPILAGMRLEVSAGTVTLAGFDYDMAARSHVAADDTSAGVVLVIGHQLLNAVKSLPGGKGATVTAEVTGSRLTVSAGNVTATAEILPMDDYPELPAMPDAAGVIASDGFAAVVKRVAAAAGTDDTLPVLTAVNMTFAAGTVKLAATDRYRLAADEVAWTGSTKAEVNVPARELAMFATAMGRDGKVTVHLGKRERGSSAGPRIAFSDGTREMIIRTEGGEFPKWSRLFPSGTGASATVDATALAAALKRAGTASERNSGVHLKFSADGVTVTAHRDGEVSSRETVPCELDVPAGEGYRVTGWRGAYNPAYLASMLAAVDGMARLAWAGPRKPVLVKPDGTAGGFRSIVMPVRVPV